MGGGPLIRFLLAHQGDSADPELLHWIKDQMDQILGVGPWVVVGTMTGIILLAPAAIMGFYLFQQRRQPELPAADPAPEETNP